jgi:hypothetical protein
MKVEPPVGVAMIVTGTPSNGALQLLVQESPVGLVEVTVPVPDPANVTETEDGITSHVSTKGALTLPWLSTASTPKV